MSLVYNFSIARLRRSFARLFLPVVRPAIPLVFESDGNNYTVQSWAKYIDLAQAQQCSVVSMDHRSFRDSEREFLLFTLWHPDDFEAHMIAERCVSATSPSPPVVQDRVRFLPCYKDSHSLTCWSFHDPRPSVADLCSIVYVVSMHFPCEHPHDNQSFCFARTVYGVLANEYQGREVVGRNNNKQAAFADAGVLSVQKRYRTEWAEFVERTTAEREAQHVEQARAKAREEGLEEGREEGRERGHEEGRAAGRAESAAKIAELERQLAMQQGSSKTH